MTIQEMKKQVNLYEYNDSELNWVIKNCEDIIELANKLKVVNENENTDRKKLQYLLNNVCNLGFDTIKFSLNIKLDNF